MALSGKYVSVATVMEKLYRNYPFQDVDFTDVVEWIGEAIAHLGIPASMYDKETTLTFVDGRAELPCDLYSLNMMKDHDSGATLLPKTSGFSFTEVSDLYDYAYQDSMYTYKLQGGYVFVDYKDDAEADISYKAFPVDDDGFPLIPDRESYIRGVVGYVAEHIAKKLYLQGLLDGNRYMLIRRDSQFDLAAAETDGKMLDRNQYENFKNAWVRMLAPWQRHDSFDAFMSNRERLKNHSS